MKQLLPILFFLSAAVTGYANDTVSVRVVDHFVSNDTVYFTLQGRMADTVAGEIHVAHLDVVFAWDEGLFNGTPEPVMVSGYDSPLNHNDQPINVYDKAFVQGRFAASNKFAIGLGMPVTPVLYYEDSVMVFKGSWTNLGRYALVGFNDPQATDAGFDWINSGSGLTTEAYKINSSNVTTKVPVKLAPFGDFPINALPFDLKIFLEGAYNSTTGEMSTALNSGGYLPLSQPYSGAPWNYSGTENVASIPNANVVDWVLVEVRQAVIAAAATSGTSVAKRAGFLLKDGSITDLDGSSDLSFEDLELDGGLNTYVVIRHRNHLAVITADPVSFANGVYAYDFTTGLVKILGTGNGGKLFSNSKAGMYAGDASGDGNIQNIDRLSYWYLVNGTSGYLPEDFNLNGQVQNNDAEILWYQNNGRSKQVP